MKSGTLVNSMTAFYFDMLMAFGNTGRNCDIGVEIIPDVFVSGVSP